MMRCVQLYWVGKTIEFCTSILGAAVPVAESSAIFTVNTALMQEAQTVDDPKSQNWDGSCANAIWMIPAVLPALEDIVNQSIEASAFMRPNVPVPVVELPNKPTQTFPSGPASVPTGMLPLSAGTAISSPALPSFL